MKVQGGLKTSYFWAGMGREGRKGLEKQIADSLGTGWGRAQMAGKLKGETTRAVLQGLQLQVGLQSRESKGMVHKVNGHKPL